MLHIPVTVLLLLFIFFIHVKKYGNCSICVYLHITTNVQTLCWSKSSDSFSSAHSSCITVKRLIIGDYLFGEIGEFFKFAKISCHQIVTLQSLDISSVGNRQINSLPNCQIVTLQSLDISSVGNRQINSLPNCHIWKTAKYYSRQIFSFYSTRSINTIFVPHIGMEIRINMSKTDFVYLKIWCDSVTFCQRGHFFLLTL